LAIAQPSGLISNILQSQTQVTSGQPVSIGGGVAGNPKAAALVGSMIAPATCTAGCPVNMTINAYNPNNYTVTGVLNINFSSQTTLNPLDISVYVNCSYGITFETFVVTNSYLCRIYPCGSLGKFSILPGTTDGLVQFAVEFNAPGTYMWTVWMGT
jgi:hypothetical protein